MQQSFPTNAHLILDGLPRQNSHMRPANFRSWPKGPTIMKTLDNSQFFALHGVLYVVKGPAADTTDAPQP
jgi:hypothetical protein